MNRAALYVRVSTNGQEEDGYSLDEQIDRLTKHCEARDWQVVDIYRDVSTGSNIKRPGMQSLIANVKKYDMVVVYKLDRLSRSQKDTLYLIEDVFEAKGVGFTSLSENMDTSSPFGRAMVGILSVFAQLEREQIKERMTMGKLGRIKNGKTSAWAKVPFGYDYLGGELVVNGVQAPVVRRMFDKYLSGTSITKLVDYLNDEGHIGKDKWWSYRTVRAVLDNAVYTGRTNFKGEVYDGIHDPIITDSVYYKTQSELERRQKEAYAKNNNPRPFQAKYLLSGLLRCGKCGAGFELIQGSVKKDGTRFKRYKCFSQSSKNHNPVRRGHRAEFCHACMYPMVDLEALVLDEVEKLRLDPGSLSSHQATDNSNERDALRAELDTVQQKLDRITLLFINGGLSIELLNKQKAELEQQQGALMKKLDKIEDDVPALPIVEAREVLSGALGNIRDLEYEDQKRIVRTLIERITLDDEDMVIRWRFV